MAPFRPRVPGRILIIFFLKKNFEFPISGLPRHRRCGEGIRRHRAGKEVRWAQGAHTHRPGKKTVISLKKHSVGSCYQYITNLGCGYFSFPLKTQSI